MITTLRYTLLLTSLAWALGSCTGGKTAHGQNTSDMNIKNAYLTTFTDVPRDQTIWRLKIEPPYGPEVQLDSFVKAGTYTPESSAILGDVRKSILLGDAIGRGGKVYALLYDLGLIKLHTYQVSRGKVLASEAVPVSEIVHGSYANFGHPIYTAEIMDIGDGILLLDQYGGTELNAAYLPLVKFDAVNHRTTTLKFKGARNELLRSMEYGASLTDEGHRPRLLETLQGHSQCPEWVARENLVGYLGREMPGIQPSPATGIRYLVFRAAGGDGRALHFLGYDGRNGAWFTSDYEERPVAIRQASKGWDLD